MLFDHRYPQLKLTKHSALVLKKKNSNFSQNVIDKVPPTYKLQGLVNCHAELHSLLITHIAFFTEVHLLGLVTSHVTQLTQNNNLAFTHVSMSHVPHLSSVLNLKP